jgi:Zn-finger nucleic acid-binding protein
MPIFKRKEEGPIDCPRCKVHLVGETVKKLGPDVDRGLHERLIDFPMAGETSSIGCPRCGGEMRLRHDGEVEVDACTSCTGVWLDLGERHRLKQQLESQDAAQADMQRRDVAFYNMLGGRVG